MARIHAATLVDPKAELNGDVDVGPYTVVGPKVRIGAGTTLGPHVVVDGHTTIGRGNRIFPFASIGLISQDRKYGGEPVTTTIGDENVIREYVSIHAGTAQDRAEGHQQRGLAPARLHARADPRGAPRVQDALPRRVVVGGCAREAGARRGERAGARTARGVPRADRARHRALAGRRRMHDAAG